MIASRLMSSHTFTTLRMPLLYPLKLTSELNKSQIAVSKLLARLWRVRAYRQKPNMNPQQ